MFTRRFYSRFSLSLICLVVVPWAIVLAMHLRVLFMPPIPKIDADDHREIAEMVLGLQSLRYRFGAYPPDFTSGDPAKEIKDYLKKKFPKRDHESDLPAYVDELGPENALCFWLDGLHENNKKYPVTGTIPPEAIPMTEKEMEAIILNSDLIKALKKEGETTLWSTRQYIELELTYRKLIEQQHKEMAELQIREPLYPFRPGRVSKKKTYRPSSSLAPLVYFRADNYEKATFKGHSQWGEARPYQADDSTPEDRRFIKPKDFQIINAGRDGRYGTESIRSMDAGMYDAHSDNVVSFSSLPLGMRFRSLEFKKAIHSRRMTIYMALICMALYPFIAAIRWQEDGISILSRSVKQQWEGTEASSYWMRILNREKKTRRANAINRFTTAERERPGRITFDGPSKAEKKGREERQGHPLSQRNRLK